MFKIVKKSNARYDLCWQSTNLSTFPTLDGAGGELAEILLRRYGQPEFKTLCEYWDAQQAPAILVGAGRHTGRAMKSPRSAALVLREPYPKGF